MADMKELIQELDERRKKLEPGGGKADIEKQHGRGKLTAWERIQKLFDPGTFQEIGIWTKPMKTGFDIDERELPRDSVIVGFGKVNGRDIYSYAHDFTVLAGTQSTIQNSKVARAMEQAMEEGIPLVGMVDSGAIRIHDLFGRAGFKVPVRGSPVGGGGGFMYYPPIMSGVVPHISLMLGPCYAGSAYSPIMADFVIMRRNIAFMSVASPPILKAVTFVDVTEEEIGGALLHSEVTGSNDLLVESDEEAIAACRELLGFLPSNWKEKPPFVDTGDSPDRTDEKLAKIVPVDVSQPYDMHEVIRSIVDDSRFFELQALYAPNMIIGFGRLSGQTVGFVANNPAVSEGCLNVNSSDKQARFIRFCDCYNIPMVYLVDTPGFLPSVEQEQSRDGLERNAAKPVFAICESTVPRITVYIRKCYGAARLMMGTERMGCDAVYAWPTADVRPDGFERAAEAIYGAEIAKAANPDEARRELMEKIRREYASPYQLGAIQGTDDIIDPRKTRPILINTLHRLSRKLEPS
ncbi:MAG: acyl-CoA carboxylase subunit beta, partial [Dehalococcoidia bacterium]|nr:acyl-CoA carboxylase subunit beta [Dehalococcoidia bacterium]